MRNRPGVWVRPHSASSRQADIRGSGPVPPTSAIALSLPASGPMRYSQWHDAAHQDLLHLLARGGQARHRSGRRRDRPGRRDALGPGRHRGRAGARNRGLGAAASCHLPADPADPRERHRRPCPELRHHCGPDRQPHRSGRIPRVDRSSAAGNQARAGHTHRRTGGARPDAGLFALRACLPARFRAALPGGAGARRDRTSPRLDGQRELRRQGEQADLPGRRPQRGQCRRGDPARSDPTASISAPASARTTSSRPKSWPPSSPTRAPPRTPRPPHAGMPKSTSRPGACRGARCRCRAASRWIGRC